MLTYATIIGYLCLTIYLANQEDRLRRQNPGASSALGAVQILLIISASLIFLAGLLAIALAAGAGPDADVAGAESSDPQTDISTAAGVTLFLATGVMGIAAFFVILSPATRGRLRDLIGKAGRYDPQSTVHATATVLALLILAGQIFSFVIQGGISGLAESINEEGVPISEVIFQAILQVFIAFLGVGLTVRRSMPDALERLGLSIPSRDDVSQGILVGLKLIAIVFVYAYIMGILIHIGVLSESTLEQQNKASDSLVRAFNTLPLAIALALSAAVGEEILFRGALQSVFGNVLTSLFFVLLHTQNLFNPGIIILFIVSYLLGVLRDQKNTTAAMIGHFVYDFLVIAISIWAASAEAV